MKTLFEIRQERRMSQKDLANKTGLSCNQISRYESGVKPVPYFDRNKIANGLEMDVTEIQFKVERREPGKRNTVRKTNQEREEENKIKDIFDTQLKLEDIETPINENPNINEYILEIGLEYVDSVFETINLLSSDREKFTRLADFKAFIKYFNQDTLKHVKNNDKKTPQVGAD